MKKLISGLFVGLALVSLAACGGGDDSSTDGGSSGGGDSAGPSGGDSSGGGGAAAKTDYTAADHSGGVKGTVKFTGERPEQKVLPIGGDDVCVAAWTDVKPVDPRAELGANGEVPHCYVALTGDGVEAYAYAADDAPEVVVDQVNCMYVPHTFGVMAGQEFVVRNSDATLHNINAKPKRNDGFNKAQAKKGDEDTFTFTKKENKIAFGCDVHKWMSAWCFVSEHPFFASTAADGTFEIANVPDGDYELLVWHESLQTKPKKVPVKVEGGKVVEQDVTLE